MTDYADNLLIAVAVVIAVVAVLKWRGKMPDTPTDPVEAVARAIAFEEVLQAYETAPENMSHYSQREIYEAARRAASRQAEQFKPQARAAIRAYREALAPDLDRARQWYDCVEDVNPEYLEPEDRAALDRLLQAASTPEDRDGGPT